MDDLERYARGDAKPEDLLTWDDHVTACGTCRARLKPTADFNAWNRAVDLDRDEAVHLTYEQLAAKVDGRLNDADSFAVHKHLQQCEDCRAEVADLVRFRRRMSSRPRNVYRSLIGLAAVAAVLALVTPQLLHRSPRNELVLPASWNSEDKALVERTLADGKLPASQSPAALRSTPNTLLGPSQPNSFALVSPVGKIVETTHPILEWQTLPEKATYRVEVYDVSFRPVAQSGDLTAGKWTVSESLPRGGIYQWQVKANSHGQTITEPSPPAPDAKFMVLAADVESQVEKARASGPLGCLLAAALLSSAGAHSEAQRELNQLPPNLEQDPRISKLLKADH